MSTPLTRPRKSGVRARNAKKIWTGETVIAGLQRFYEREGRAPRAPEWRPANGLPVPGTLPRAGFKGINEALDAAGLPRNRVGRPPAQRPVEPAPPARSGSGTPAPPSGPAARVLQALVNAGNGTRPGELAAMTRQPQEAVMAALEQLRQYGLAAPWYTPPGAEEPMSWAPTLQARATCRR